MNLDDRMRSAHKRQLDDITNHTRGSTFTARPTPVLQRSAPVLVVVVVAMIAFFGIRAVVDDGATTIESADSVDLNTASTTPDSPEGGDGEAPVEELPTTTTDREYITTTTVWDEDASSSNTAPPEETPQPEETAQPQESSAPTETTIPVETTVPEQTTVPIETTVPETTTPAVVVDPGLPSVKCPSGQRAPLELAALRYVGPNVGWNRLDDLVDEQDTEFTFEAWEPGYPDEVTVEVTLNQPVDAVDIRVAQDPFTPVSGDIEISTFFEGDLVDTFLLPLSGTDGWIANEFATTARIDQFTITRDGVSENIMEVLVCVE